MWWIILEEKSNFFQPKCTFSLNECGILCVLILEFLEMKEKKCFGRKITGKSEDAVSVKMPTSEKKICVQFTLLGSNIGKFSWFWLKETQIFAIDNGKCWKEDSKVDRYVLIAAKNI